MVYNILYIYVYMCDLPIDISIATVRPLSDCPVVRPGLDQTVRTLGVLQRWHLQGNATGGSPIPGKNIGPENT